MNSEYLSAPIGRKEYWISFLVSWLVVSAVVAIINAVIGSAVLSGLVGLIGWAYWIILQVKRLKDANMSYAWLLLNILTFVGIIVIGCFPSGSARRQY